jgi:uncharacterized protein with von Willebrand factor type A (vWA) domain
METAGITPDIASRRVAGFINHLRLNDFVLGPNETGLALRVLSRGLTDRDTARQQLKVLLTGRHDEWTRFDTLFEAYWFTRGRERSRWRTVGGPSATKPGPRTHKAWSDHLGAEEGEGQNTLPQIEAEGHGQGHGAATGRLIASDKTGRTKIDLRHIVDLDEIVEAERLAYRLACAIRYRISRRLKAAKSGSRIDLRRTIRASLAHGGEPMELRRRRVTSRPIRLVVFLDVSGSMKHYSRFFLQFVRGLTGVWVDTDAYLIHTRLVRVTDALRDGDPMRAMTRLSLMAEGFGGGTRLGDCLSVFNQSYAKAALNSRSVVIIISDGYDTGTPERLSAELARLKKRSHRIIWLNPLLGWENYQPVTAAMAAAMPHIDHFAAANTLETLAGIEQELAHL